MMFLEEECDEKALFWGGKRGGGGKKGEKKKNPRHWRVPGLPGIVFPYAH